MRVPIFPAAHAFRAGSRIRVTLQAPGGERSRWRFETLDDGTRANIVGLGGAYASRLVLPVIEGATANGTPLPAPTALRGQPSRALRRRVERRLAPGQLRRADEHRGDLLSVRAHDRVRRVELDRLRDRPARHEALRVGWSIRSAAATT